MSDTIDFSEVFKRLPEWAYENYTIQLIIVTIIWYVIPLTLLILLSVFEMSLGIVKFKGSIIGAIIIAILGFPIAFVVTQISKGR